MPQLRFQRSTRGSIGSISTIILAKMLVSDRVRLKFTKQICQQSLAMLAVCGYVLVQTAVNAAIFDRSGRKIPDREVNTDRVNWQILSTTTGRKYNGVGVLDTDYGVCTGFAISTSPNPQAPVYVLTNAHCQGTGFNKLPGNSEVIVNRSTTKTEFILNYFKDFKGKRLTIPAKRMVYGTMKNNDIAILELAMTQRELTTAGIVPLQLAATPPAIGEPTIVVGVPSEGVKDELSVLHAATCKVGQQANVKEDVYNWQRSIRHQCSIVGGMSGSPMISLKTNRVVGIINTGVNDSAGKQPQCSLNRPCEVIKNGLVQTFPQENYAQLVDRIPSCFDRQGIFNLDRESCQLERPPVKLINNDQNRIF